MIRSITGFHQDDEGDWVADLSCLHAQHIRHRPPFDDRAWIRDASLRNDRLGSAIDCPLCDRAEMPDGLVHLRTAGPWDESTLPKALRNLHQVGASTWAILKVLVGEVGFHLEVTPPLEVRLQAGTQQAIPPLVPHRVAPEGQMRVIVEFWGRPQATTPQTRE